MSGHPSHYALDRAALGAAGAEVATHVERCARCARVVAARREAPASPAWVGAVHVGEAARRSWWRGRRGWRWLVPIPALAAAGVLVMVTSRDVLVDAGEMRAKGGPSVTVHVKRGVAVAVWDGHTPLRTGDRLRLTVRASGFRRVSVASVGVPGAEPVMLYEGALEPGAETALPLSFRMDDGGRREVLSVILSRRPVPPSEHANFPARGGERGVWATRLEIPREVER